MSFCLFAAVVIPVHVVYLVLGVILFFVCGFLLIVYSDARRVSRDKLLARYLYWHGQGHANSAAPVNANAQPSEVTEWSLPGVLFSIVVLVLLIFCIIFLYNAFSIDGERGEKPAALRPIVKANDLVAKTPKAVFFEKEKKLVVEGPIPVGAKVQVQKDPKAPDSPTFDVLEIPVDEALFIRWIRETPAKWEVGEWTEPVRKK